jgi:hypothetical protein
LREVLKVTATKNKTKLGVLMLLTWLHLHAQHTLSFRVFPCSKDPFTKESCIFAIESGMLGLSILFKKRITLTA